MINETVTYYSSHRSEIVRPVKLAQVLADFKNGKYADMISRVRHVLLYDGEKAYRIAKRDLPAIAFCGEFTGGHSKENLIRHNNLLVFDIDHLTNDEMLNVRMRLMSEMLIFAFWISPSGSGYKGLIRLEYQNVKEGAVLDDCYKKAFIDATLFFKNNLGIELDRSCSDFSRICYVCWDENLYVNEAAKKMSVDCETVIHKNEIVTRRKEERTKTMITAFKPVNVAGKNKQHDRNMISSIIKYLSKRGLSITYTYDEWLRVGFAIASTFNYDLGVKYFLALSRLDSGKFDEEACIEKLQECYTSGTGEITLGTIVEMARKKGFKGSSEDI